ncbi:hypothetical protein AAHA92_06403 [Salvia divinorum]|uniref:Uncharacterized protein n=1 Tax=Salvia divinorum TaxID=28513 RepID=A0ABD1I6M1_SALDI
MASAVLPPLLSVQPPSTGTDPGAPPQSRRRLALRRCLGPAIVVQRCRVAVSPSPIHTPAPPMSDSAVSVAVSQAPLDRAVAAVPPIKFTWFDWRNNLECKAR